MVLSLIKPKNIVVLPQVKHLLFDRLSDLSLPLQTVLDHGILHAGGILYLVSAIDYLVFVVNRFFYLLFVKVHHGCMCVLLVCCLEGLFRRGLSKPKVRFSQL